MATPQAAARRAAARAVRRRAEEEGPCTHLTTLARARLAVERRLGRRRLLADMDAPHGEQGMGLEGLAVRAVGGVVGRVGVGLAHEVEEGREACGRVWASASAPVRYLAAQGGGEEERAHSRRGRRGAWRGRVREGAARLCGGSRESVRELWSGWEAGLDGLEERGDLVEAVLFGDGGRVRGQVVDELCGHGGWVSVAEQGHRASRRQQWTHG